MIDGFEIMKAMLLVFGKTHSELHCWKIKTISYEILTNISACETNIFQE
jgi:hypothetical protein